MAMLAPDTIITPRTKLAETVPVVAANRETPDGHRTFGQFVEEEANHGSEKNVENERTGSGPEPGQDPTDPQTECLRQEQQASEKPGSAIKGHAVDSERSGPISDTSAELSEERLQVALQSGFPATKTPEVPPVRSVGTEQTGQGGAVDDKGPHGLHIHTPPSLGVIAMAPETPDKVGPVAISTAVPRTSGGNLTAEANTSAICGQQNSANDSSFTIKGAGLVSGKGGDLPPESTNGELRAFSVGQQGLWPHPQPMAGPSRLWREAVESHTLRLFGEFDAVTGVLPSDPESLANKNSDDPASILVTQAPDRTQLQTLAATRAEGARLVAHQMSAAIAARPETGGVDIALNPAELGRVSMALRAGEDGVFLSISTERPETMELMRRHIGDLTAEFQELGYKDISFEFQTRADGAGGRSGEADHPPQGETTNPAETAPDARAPKSNPSTGIDMRL